MLQRKIGRSTGMESSAQAAPGQAELRRVFGAAGFDETANPMVMTGNVPR
jgi:hypothetical protein